MNSEAVNLQEEVDGEKEDDDEQEEDREEEDDDEQDVADDRKVSKSSTKTASSTAVTKNGITPASPEFGKTQTGSTTASEGVRYPSPLPSGDFDYLEDYKSWQDGTLNSMLAGDIEAINLEAVNLQEEVDREEEDDDEQEDREEEDDDEQEVADDRKVSKSSTKTASSTAVTKNGITPASPEFGKTQTGSTTASEGVRYPSPLPSEDFDHLEDYHSWRDDSDMEDEDDLQCSVPRVSCRQYQIQKMMEMEQYLKTVSKVDKELFLHKISRSETLNALQPKLLLTHSLEGSEHS